DSKNVRDFALSDICVYLGLSQTSYYALTRFGKGISLTFHLLAQALTVVRTVNCRPHSQCCQMHGNYPLDDHFEHLVRYNLATLSTLPLPLVALSTTAHDICMWKRCQNFVAGEGAGSSAYEKDVKTSSRGEGAGSSVCYTLTRPLL